MRKQKELHLGKTNIKEIQYVKQIKTYDKNKSLEMLCRHLGTFKDTVEVKGNINTNIPNIKELTTAELKKLAKLGEDSEK